MIKVCFISFNSYPLFVKKSLEYFGGAEVQISQIAQYLAKDRRFRISLMVTNYGQKSQLKFGRLTLHIGMRRFFPASIQVIRFLLTLRKINADIYVERTLNLKVGLICLFCKLFKKRFVYMVAHDWDCQSDFNNYLKGLSRFSFRFGLTRANLVICQTKQQQFKLKQNFNISAALMRSVIKPTSAVKQLKKDIFLWVGRADKWKRPEKFIQLVKKLPKEKFVMVCRQGNDKKIYLKIKNLAQKQINLKFLKVVNYEQIINYFQQAKVFVNTSTAEGFPNTFLQAGLTKTPVFSYQVNPDDYLNKYHCGLVGQQNFDQLLNHPARLKTMGQNHYLYVKKFHSLKNLIVFKRVLKQLI